jgi:hypothetical protein
MRQTHLGHSIWIICVGQLLVAAGCSDDVVCPGGRVLRMDVCVCPEGTIEQGDECLQLESDASSATAFDGGDATAEAGLDSSTDGASGAWTSGDSSSVDASPDDTGTAADTGTTDDADSDVATVEAGPSCVPTTEVCNGSDDDCDGKVDEDVAETPIGQSCSNGGKGVCAMSGTQICFNGAPKCSAPPPMPSAEICDGIDNDCQNGIDDAFPEKGMTCTVGEGACANTGVKECDPADPAKLRCSVAPKAPTCGSSCEPMPTSECAAGAGDCKGTAAWVCDAAASVWRCPAVEKPKTCTATGSCSPLPAEVCDGVDNDCDGTIDEGVVTVWYPDCDADGFAVAAGTQEACTKPSTPGCLNWMAVAPVPAAVDCDDSNDRVYPGAQPRVEPNFVSTVDWRSYSGDTDCNGTVDRSPTYDLATNDTTPFPVVEKAVNYPVCASASASCSNTLTNCYLKYPDGGGTAQAVPLSCGNSSIALFDASKCPSSSAFRLRVARLVCK